MLDDVIMLELQFVVKEFLDESNVWVDPILLATTANVTDYPVESEFGSVNRLLNVVNENGSPVAASLLEPPNDEDLYVVRLAVAPSTSGDLIANVSLTPDSAIPVADSVPDWMWGRYRSGFIDGVLGRLFSQPAKPYTNGTLAVVHSNRFRSAASKAKREMLNRNRFRGQGWAFPQSFATTRR